MLLRFSIHSTLYILAIFFCLFPTIIYANHDKGQLQIRFHKTDKSHAYVVIGHHYEYDYLEIISPRRRIVRKEKAEAAGPENRAKSMLGNANQEFDVAKADQIFYEMVTQEGWVKRNFSMRKESRFCRSFVYEFVCKLFIGKCPKQEEWPEEFVERDLYNNRGQPSVFKESYENARKYFTKVEYTSSCHLKDIELKIEVVGQMDPEMLPSIVQIKQEGSIHHILLMIGMVKNFHEIHSQPKNG